MTLICKITTSQWRNDVTIYSVFSRCVMRLSLPSGIALPTMLCNSRSWICFCIQNFITDEFTQNDSLKLFDPYLILFHSVNLRRHLFPYLTLGAPAPDARLSFKILILPVGVSAPPVTWLPTTLPRWPRAPPVVNRRVIADDLTPPPTPRRLVLRRPPATCW